MGKKQKLVEKTTTKETDFIVQTMKEMNKLDRKAAYEVVPSLLDSVGFTHFRLGGVLSHIKENRWWADEASKFDDFIETKFGIHHRKARYLIKIYECLVETEIPWDKVSSVGWTKLKELVEILTIDNVDEWVTRAHNMTTLNLQAAVKAFKANNLDTDGTTEPDTSGVSTVTFKVHPDQKETINDAIDQAMDESDTEFKGVALELICMNFLSGASTQEPKQVSLKATLENYEIEKVLETVESIWPDLDITVVM